MIDPTPATPSRRLSVRAFLLSWAFLAVLFAIWAVATPPSASPDEPAHIVKAASVVRGELIGTPSPVGNVVTVPAYIARSQSETCYAFDARVTADCPLPPLTDPSQPVKAATSAGLYNPVYYALVGWPSLIFHDSTGIYAMRVVSGIITALFAAIAFMLIASLPRRRLPILAFAVGVTPMLLFLGGSVNPNAFEATATLAVFAGMLAIALDPTRSLLTWRVVLVMVSAILAVNARGLSPIWVVAALLIPLFLLRWREVVALLRRRIVIIAIVGIFVGAAGAGIWLLATNSLGNALVHPDQSLGFPGVGMSPIKGFLLILIGTVGYSQGLVGLFGWLDTPAPYEVFFIWAALIGAVLLASWTLLRGRAAAFSVILFAAFLLLPPVIQGAYVTGGGMIWQGRYNLPLYLCLLVGCSAALAAFVRPFPAFAWPRLVWIVAGVTWIGQVWAFIFTLRRYTVGSTGSWKTMLIGSPAWAPPGGVLLSIILFAVVSAVATVFLARAVTGTRRVVTALSEPAEEGLEERRADPGSSSADIVPSTSL